MIKIVKKFFSALYEFFFGMNIGKKENKKILPKSETKNIYLFSSDFSDVILKNKDFNQFDVNQAVEDFDQYSLVKKRNFTINGNLHQCAVLINNKKILTLDSDKKVLHGSVFIIWTENTTWLQRCDEHPTKEMNYFSALAKQEDMLEFKEKLESDYYPVRKAKNFNEKNLSLYVHTFGSLFDKMMS